MAHEYFQKKDFSLRAGQETSPEAPDYVLLLKADLLRPWSVPRCSYNISLSFKHQHDNEFSTKVTQKMWIWACLLILQ